MGSNSTYSHVDVVNPLLNGCLTGQIHALLNVFDRSIFDLPRSVDLISRTSRLLIFLKRFQMKRILTKRLRNSNDGRPLTLYQEACCGLISGTTTEFVWQPFQLACSQVGLNNFT